MFQIIYISTAQPPMPAKECADILSSARRNNDRNQVTGLLLFNGKRFLQALEGDEAVVLRTFQEIGRDPRHKAVVLLQQREIETREFGDWTMAYRDMRDGSETLDEAVTHLLHKAGASTRALFKSTSQLHG